MIKNLLIALSVLSLTGLSLYHINSLNQEKMLKKQFIDFKRKYAKSYGTSTELEFRFQIFCDTLKHINRVNLDKSKTYNLALNKFSDLTFKEIKSQYLEDIKINTQLYSNSKSNILVKRKKVDWRQLEGAVNPIKDQGANGASWAFSAVAALETAVWKSTGKNELLSEQELIDCSGAGHLNSGTTTGFPENAYDYVINNGLATQDSYPYRGMKQACNETNRRKPGRVSMSTSSYLEPASVEGLINAAEQNVVSVYLEVNQDFMNYSEGIYTATDDCGLSGINFSVAVVGYDLSGDLPYFIVRNSWGKDWGEDGYIRVAVGTGNGTCGIANRLDVFPIV